MKEKVKIVLKNIKKFRIFIVFAIILLSINSYAWFIYISRVDTSFTAKVRSWNVMFQIHDNDIASEVVFTVGDIYPGMPNYNDFASIVNTGETAGEVYFEIKRVEILGEVFTRDIYSNEQLIDILKNNYPFKINLSLTDTLVRPGRTELFNIDVKWPYESGNDELDTEWGMKAYNYLNQSTSTTCISIAVEIKVNQESVE